MQTLYLNLKGVLWIVAGVALGLRSESTQRDESHDDSTGQSRPTEG